MNQTNFRFFKNTPLVDFQNTIHFSSNQERDAFFLEGGHYPELPVENVDFNFIRDRSTITLDVPYNSMRGVNYCTFKSDFEDIRYYAYVVKYEYINDRAVEVYLLIDGIMTYTQGNVLETLPNLTVQRQHLQKANYNANLWELKNNSDIIKTHTKSYFKNESLLFTDLTVLIKSSADLKANFGTVNDPKIKTSKGKQLDSVTSPLNLYACSINDFNKLMGELSEFAWISQNITSLSILPSMFFEGILSKITFSSTDSLSGVDYLYEINASDSNKFAMIDQLKTRSYNMAETLALFGLDPEQDKHLLRNEYTTTELYNYSGGQLFIDNGQLHPVTGLTYLVDMITGYHNEIKVYVDNYRAERNAGIKTGAYLNDSLTLDKFDDIPMLINNFDLALSKNANVRALAESKLITGRIDKVIGKDSSLQDRLFNAVNLASKITPGDLFGRFSDEKDFYDQQKAEWADMALETPTITNQTTGNSFNIANRIFGIHFKYSKPNSQELDKIRAYYKLFGYQLPIISSKLDLVDSMSICNYVQFSGSWFIPNADVSVIEMMKAQFENGVRLWHNNGNPNPMNQFSLHNVMVK